MPMVTASSPSRNPQPNQLASEFRQKIDSGELRPGDRLPGFFELRRRHGIDASVLEMVHSLLEEEGYILRERDLPPLVVQRRLPQFAGRYHGARHRKIAVVGKGFSWAPRSAYWHEVHLGLKDGARSHGLELQFLKSLDELDASSVDGVLLGPWQQPAAAELCLREPRVSLMMARPDMSCVLADEAYGVSLATEHLLALGHQRIAYLHSNHMAVARVRLDSWLHTLEAAGITPALSWCKALRGNPDFGNSFTRVGRESMQHWLENGFRETECTAILAHNDNVAKGVMEVLDSAGLSVPEMISVVGFDDQQTCEHLRPRLASVAVPLRAMARRAVEMLVERMEHPLSPHCEHALQPTLAPRESAVVAPEFTGILMEF